jgi:hypothetical protein
MSHEVFLAPWSYKLEVSIMLAAFGTLIALLLLAPKKPSELGRRVSPAD